MVISRSQMGSQLTGNKMKKPVKKKALGGIMMDKMSDGAIKAPVGIIPQLMMASQRRNQPVSSDGMPVEAPAMDAGPMQRPELATRGMKKGGKVRGDGICQRGRTKGTMR